MFFLLLGLVSPATPSPGESMGCCHGVLDFFTPFSCLKVLAAWHGLQNLWDFPSSFIPPSFSMKGNEICSLLWRLLPASPPATSPLGGVLLASHPQRRQSQNNVGRALGPLRAGVHSGSSRLVGCLYHLSAYTGATVQLGQEIL